MVNVAFPVVPGARGWPNRPLPFDDVKPVDQTQPLGDEPEAETAPEHGDGEAGPPADVDDAPPPQETPPRPPTIGQLRRERKKLWNQRQETVYHVGGLAVDMHRRGMLGDELVSRRSDIVLGIDARILEIDGQLADIDHQRRQARVKMPAPAGYCLSCGGPYLPDAAFCSRCGARVHPGGDDQETQVITIPEGQAP